jgi:hypothetical protein
MKKVYLVCLFLFAISKGYAQDAITISPTGTESLKFNNSFKEKITFYEESPTSKIGIGTSNEGGYFKYMHFYVPPTGSFLFGSGSLNSFTERMRITGTGKVGIGVTDPLYSLEVKGVMRIKYNSSYYPSGLYIDKFVPDPNNFPPGGLNNTYLGTDVTNNFAIKSAMGADHTFYSGFNSPSELELLRIKPNGNLEITGTIKNETDQTPVFQTTWANYSAGFADGTYYKDKENRVHLNGSVKSFSPVNYSTIFTLPIGYRPSGTLTFNVDTIFGTSARILVTSAGEVIFYSNTNNVNNEYQYVSLNGISFRVN